MPQCRRRLTARRRLRGFRSCCAASPESCVDGLVASGVDPGPSMPCLRKPGKEDMDARKTGKSRSMPALARPRFFSPICTNLRCNGAADSSPPPCGEGSGVGVDGCCTAEPRGTTPHPNPPPQGGRESQRRAAGKLAQMSSPPTRGHKGGGSSAGAPHAPAAIFARLTGCSLQDIDFACVKRGISFCQNSRTDCRDYSPRGERVIENGSRRYQSRLPALISSSKKRGRHAIRSDISVAFHRTRNHHAAAACRSGGAARGKKRHGEEENL